MTFQPRSARNLPLSGGDEIANFEDANAFKTSQRGFRRRPRELEEAES